MLAVLSTRRGCCWLSTEAEAEVDADAEAEIEAAAAAAAEAEALHAVCSLITEQQSGSPAVCVAWVVAAQVRPRTTPRCRRCRSPPGVAAADARLRTSRT